MKKAAPLAFLQKRKRSEKMKAQQLDELDLNIFVVTFNSMKEAQKNISGGDPYECEKCKAILNKYSRILSAKEYEQNGGQEMKMQIKPNQFYWECQFCSYPNVITIDKEQIPTKDDVVYLLESQLQNQGSDNDSTMIFCIDTSGSMNITTELQGKVDLKFGLSPQEIEMLKTFMEPGDEAQFNFLPGNQNKNKTFVSRKQCVFSAIESQLKELKKVDPHKKIGFISFNSEITVLGDDKAPTVNIVGDKLNNYEGIINSLNGFKLTQPVIQSFEGLTNSLNKQEAKGQTALGPALISAIQIASKGNPGSTVILCTDGLANRGIGNLEALDEQKESFYSKLAATAKEKNIAVNIMTIKGEGCKMQIIGQLAEETNGNMKVINPEKIADDFANVLKDEVVGMNVQTRIKLHKAMVFRNEDKESLKENQTVLYKQFANATVNTKVSFEYEVRCEQDLKFMEIDIDKIKKVPFQTQIVYTSPRGGKFLRVISSESETTFQKKQLTKKANLPVVHQRVTSMTANLYKKGDFKGSQQRNNVWSNYLQDNFQEQKYQKHQTQFTSKNMKLNRAINNKESKPARKQRRKSVEKQEKKEEKFEMIEECEEEEINMKKSIVDSDEDQMQLMENLMEKQSYNLSEDQVD